MTEFGPVIKAVNGATEKYRVYIDDPEEAPGQVEVQEGDRGGYYYETGQEDEDESPGYFDFDEGDLPNDLDMEQAEALADEVEDQAEDIYDLGQEEEGWPDDPETAGQWAIRNVVDDWTPGDVNPEEVFDFFMDEMRPENLVDEAEPDEDDVDRPDGADDTDTGDTGEDDAGDEPEGSGMDNPGFDDPSELEGQEPTEAIESILSTDVVDVANDPMSEPLPDHVDEALDLNTDWTLGDITDEEYEQQAQEWYEEHVGDAPDDGEPSTGNEDQPADVPDASDVDRFEVQEHMQGRTPRDPFPNSGEEAEDLGNAMSAATEIPNSVTDAAVYTVDQMDGDLGIDEVDAILDDLNVDGRAREIVYEELDRMGTIEEGGGDDGGSPDGDDMDYEAPEMDSISEFRSEVENHPNIDDEMAENINWDYIEESQWYDEEFLQDAQDALEGDFQDSEDTEDALMRLLSWYA